MARFSFSVTGLLLAMLFVAIGFWAIFSHSALIASVVYSFYMVVLGWGLVGAMARRGPRRAFWIGFAVSGWIYAWTAFEIESPLWLRWQQREPLVTTKLLDKVAQWRVPREVGAKVSAQWNGGNYYPATIVEINNGQFLVDWDDGSADSWVVSTQMRGDLLSMQVTGHSIFGSMLAWFAGWMAWCCFGCKAGETTPIPKNDSAI